MHVKRTLALFLGVVLSLSARAGVTSTPVNDGEVDQTFQYRSATAKTVSVAGEFSNWSELPLTRDDSGTWSRTLHLKPGYYGYKLVVDGEWILDPANPARKTVNDLENSGVSVGGVLPSAGAAAGVNKIPTTFSFSDARAASVLLAGEFNNWADNEDGKVTGHTEWLLKSDGSGNWTLTVPLAPGKYRFKYVIDGGARWEKDRRLPSTSDDNSLIEVKAAAAEGSGRAGGGNGVTFQYTDSKATTVHLAGDFNGWLDNEDGKVSGHGEWLMQNDGAGHWKLTTQLSPGRHRFKYAVDGGARWETDPRQPVATDGNSVIEVPSGAPASATGVSGAAGSAPTFSYSDLRAKSVSVAGDFNQWSATANTMQKDPSGVWIASIPLKPGKYQYKFVVDGNWKQDPLNPDAADDTFGGKNSVKTIGP
ncbi:MAG: glycogen-binding domain-containing protein [Verrucomicrobiia bacterium]